MIKSKLDVLTLLLYLAIICISNDEFVLLWLISEAHNFTDGYSL